MPHDIASARTRDPASGRIQDIEVLRGYAILMVMVSHITGWLTAWPIPGWSHIVDNYFNFFPGVDLFFVVSGFVIGRVLLPDLARTKGGLDFFKTTLIFWVRRAWRLLPAAWFWLSITLVLSAVFNRSGAFGLFHDNFEAAVAAFLLVANIRLAEAFGHFGIGASSHYWSLSLEEQFYLLLPGLVWFARRFLPQLITVMFLVFLLLPDQSIVSCVRLHGLLLGVGLAQLASSPVRETLAPRFLRGHPLARLAVTVLPLLAMSALDVFGQRILPERFGAIALLGAIPVWAASFDAGLIWPGGRGARAMSWVGARSYVLYLAHVPCYCATREALARIAPVARAHDVDWTLAHIAIGVGLTVVAAELTHRFVEVPLRDRGKRIAASMAAA